MQKKENGSITFGGRELKEMTDAERSGSIGYLGHDPELFDDTIRNTGFRLRAGNVI